MTKEAGDALAIRLGNSIRRHRVERGWTQERLAEFAQTSVNHISYIERGERLPSVPMLIQIAQALKITVGGLLGETEPDAWAARVLALSKSLSDEAKGVVIAMLQGAMRGETTDPAPSSPKAKPAKKRGPLKLPSV